MRYEAVDKHYLWNDEEQDSLQNADTSRKTSSMIEC
jgi:hypothetical protein